MKTYLYIFSAATALVFAAFFYGQKIGQKKTLIKWQANQIELARAYEREQFKAANKAQAIRDQLFEVENAWLNEARQTRIEFREREKEIINHAQVDPDPDLVVCRLTGQRLQFIQSAIMHANGG